MIYDDGGDLYGSVGCVQLCRCYIWSDGSLLQSTRRLLELPSISRGRRSRCSRSSAHPASSHRRRRSELHPTATLRSVARLRLRLRVYHLTIVPLTDTHETCTRNLGIFLATNFDAGSCKFLAAFFRSKEHNVIGATTSYLKSYD